ncbi:hypothetical protein SESBI_50228 [Sesbania bispinosa]|nr:hypothetical protein SESBI_50228 [Sesbania bispinosa]
MTVKWLATTLWHWLKRETAGRLRRRRPLQLLRLLPALSPSRREMRPIMLAWRRGRELKNQQLKRPWGNESSPAVAEKLKADEVRMTEAPGKVKTLTDENIHLEENNTKLAEEVAQLKAALATKKTEAIQVVLEKQKVVQDVECFFHTAIDQIKYLNPDVELRTKGMSTLCIVCDDKWYRDIGKYFVEEMSGDEEITPPPIKPIPLKEDVEREEKKGPTESEMVDLGLDDSKA